MRYWIYHTDTGAISGWSDAAAAPVLPAGYAAVPGDAAVADPVGTRYVGADGKPAARIAVTALPASGWVSVDGAAPVPVAQAPTSGDHVLTLVGQYSGTITLVSLATVQAARWAAAKAYREQRMAAGCASPKGAVQTDPASQRKVDSAAREAMFWKLQKQVNVLSTVKVTLGATWSIDWTMTDNSVVTHDSDAMLALADAVTSFVTACQVASRAVRAKIYAAATFAAVAAIDITAGYPS